MFDHQIVHPFPLTLSSIPRPFPPSFPPNVQLEEDLTLQMGYRATATPASVWGPTCDSIDCVRNVVALPAELEVGDWLGWGEMGAYTICAASTFNG
jgi:ornithine decarboxylase